jgi:rRNA maturation protein Nop10
LTITFKDKRIWSRKIEMKDFDEKYATLEDIFPCISAPVSKDRSSITKRERCPSCGRDTSQKNLLHPSKSKSGANQKEMSHGYDICQECGGLRAGSFDGI